MAASEHDRTDDSSIVRDRRPDRDHRFANEGLETGILIEVTL